MHLSEGPHLHRQSSASDVISSSQAAYLIAPLVKLHVTATMGIDQWRLIAPWLAFLSEQSSPADWPSCLWTPKSSSSQFTRLDNSLLTAGSLFAQRLLSSLIASDLMGDCWLLVDCGDPHSVMAMAKQHRENKAGLSFSACNYWINISLFA